jgi:lysozyme
MHRRNDAPLLRPLDKAVATAMTYNLGYFLRGLLLLPRVEEGTDVDQRDDRTHEPKQVRKVPRIVEKDDSTLSENLQATIVSKFISDIHGASSLDNLKVVANDIKKVVKSLDLNLPWWDSMTEARQRVLADMCFNMGIGTLLTFHNTLAAMKAGDYEAAARGMELSHWATQVGRRAETLAAMMRRGI